MRVCSSAPDQNPLLRPLVYVAGITVGRGQGRPALAPPACTQVAGHSFEYPAPSLPPGREPGPGTADRQESVCVNVCSACKLGWARSYVLGCTVSARARNPRVLESGRGGVTSPPCRSVVTSPLTPAAGTGSRPPVPSVSLTGRGPQPTAAAGGRSECEVGPPHACGRTQPVRLGRSGRAGTPTITIPYPGLERSQMI